ncbi:hypothetical protein PROH_19575, partial [Prochlorothrix hollandica PCC 9006 = CALU 1027]
MLEALLGAGGTVAIAAAAGLGGVGKTALARQYVGRYRADYPAGMWWLEPGDRVGGLVIEAEILGWGAPPETLTTDQQRAQWVYQQWLERFPEGSRLLVWDDGEKFNEIRPFLPSDPRFQVLLTTRSKWGQPVRRLDVDTLPPSDAFRLLRTLMGDDERLRREVPQAKALCQWLGYLPLALELVGRYLAVRPGVTLAKTLERLEQQRLAARSLSNVPEEMEYQYTVQAAFELSWQTLAAPEQALLGALSLFGLAPIPGDLIQSALPGWDEEDLEDGLAALVGRSLVSLPSASGVTYALHALVREFGRGKLETELAEQGDPLRRGVAAALVAVAKTVPQTVTLQVLEQLQGAVPHLEVVAQELTDWIVEDEVITPMTRLAWLAQGQNRWSEAERWKSQCLHLTETRFGPTHPDTASSLNNLAGLYRAMGRYEEALPLYGRSLAIWEQELGANHPATATSLNNLAELYSSMGRYEEALSLYQRSLVIWEQELGANHPATATSLSGLALLYSSMGRYEEALPLYQRSLAIDKEVYGENHPEIATDLNGLALLYQSMGRYEEALPLYGRSLAIREQELGANHPATATSLNNLAGLYSSMGRYEEALPLFRRSLAIREQELGANHPYTASSLNNLAGLYRSMGRYEAALPLSQRSLAIYEQALGANHPATATSLNNLALLYQSMGRYEEALPLYGRSLAIREQELGANHPSTATCLNNLAGLYKSMGRYEEALPLYGRSLAIWEQELGANHPDTATSLNNLAGLYES